MAEYEEHEEQETSEPEDSNIWDLAAFVEDHPDDYPQRWRLAKKFYKAWEYRLALEHLQVLKNEWKRKRNVTRYLAATYLRLTRYESAIHELEEAIKEWPDEIALYIQLAQVLDVGGTPHDAINVWKDVLNLEPDNKTAPRAIKKLTKKVQKERVQNKKPKESADKEELVSGVDREDIPCPNCRSKNSPEFKFCWNCHSSLYGRAENEEEAVDSDTARESYIPWGTLAGFTIVGLLALSVYVTLNLYAEIQSFSVVQSVPNSAWEFLGRDLLMTRISIGVAALLVWPMIWRIGAAFVGDKKIYNGTLYQSGAVMALSTYALIWLPRDYAYLIPLVPAVLSAIICFVGLKISFKTAAALWVTQGFIATLLIAAMVAGQNGMGLVLEFPAILQYSVQERNEADYNIEGPTPVTVNLRWASSGSTWLDEHASSAGFQIDSGPHEGRLVFEIQKDGKTLAFKEYLGDSYQFEFPGIEPGVNYLLTVTGNEDVPIEVLIRSVLSLESSTQ